MNRSSPTSTRRTASGIPVVPALDGFRAYALLGVVVAHLLIVSGALATPGTTFDLVTYALLGNIIDAFFIISGFVLFLPTVVRGGKFGGIRSYGIARAVRLLPAYWLSLVVVLALIAFVPTESATFTGDPATVGGVAVTAFPSPSSIALHLGGLQLPAKLFDNGFAIGFGANGPLWIISVIVAFYVVLPLVAKPYFRYPLLGLGAAAAVTLGWKEAVLHLGSVFHSLGDPSSPSWLIRLIATDQFPGWAFSFALGMTGAWAYVKLLERRPLAAIAPLAARVAGLVLPVYMAFAYLYSHYSFELPPPVVGSWARGAPFIAMGWSICRAVLIAAVALGPYWLQRPFVNQPVRQLARVSYSLYLIHFVIILYVGVLLLGLPRNGTVPVVGLWLAVVLSVSLGYAYLATRFLEEPIRRWARRLPATASRPLPIAVSGSVHQR